MLPREPLVRVSSTLQEAGDGDLRRELADECEVRSDCGHRPVRVAVPVSPLLHALRVHPAVLEQDGAAAQQAALVGCAAQPEHLADRAVLKDAREDSVDAGAAGEVADDPAGCDAVGGAHHGVVPREDGPDERGVRDNVERERAGVEARPSGTEPVRERVDLVTPDLAVTQDVAHGVVPQESVRVEQVEPAYPVGGERIGDRAADAPCTHEQDGAPGERVHRPVTLELPEPVAGRLHGEVRRDGLAAGDVPRRELLQPSGGGEVVDVRAVRHDERP